MWQRGRRSDDLDDLDRSGSTLGAVYWGPMPASQQLMRKFHALVNRVDELLARVAQGVRGVRPWSDYDPLDVIPLFERWKAVREELVATEPELLDLPAYEPPKPSGASDNDGRGIIERPQIERMRRSMRDAWDILNHPSSHQQEGSMSRLANDDITLVKPDGSEHKAKASVQSGKIFVFDKRFPAAIGDEIHHVLPSGVEQRFEVLDPGFIGGHYEIKVRNAATPRRVPAPSVVHHHYNNSGITNVMGPDGVASGNTNSVQITRQTLNLGDPRIASELGEIRKALSTETDDDDSAIEAGNVASAQKALKAGDEGAFRAAMKRLGVKAWGLAEKLALTWMTTEGRHLLGLPPG